MQPKLNFIIKIGLKLHKNIESQVFVGQTYSANLKQYLEKGIITPFEERS